MKRKGSLLMGLGAALILAAAILAAFNMLEARQAQQASEQVVQVLVRQITPPETIPEETQPAETQPEDAQEPEIPEVTLPDYLRFPGMEMPVVNVDGRDYVATLAIPTLELELPVISEWSYPALKKSPCRYQGSAYTGDLILMAHNYDSHFGRLKNLRPGDRVAVTDMDGNEFSYQVVELEELPGNAIEDMAAGEWDLTLFTCTYGGRSRVTVRCELITQ